MKSIPILKCRNIQASIDFYTRVLDFQLGKSEPMPESDPAHVVLQNGGAELHLSSFSGDGQFGTAVYVQAENVDALFQKYRARGLDQSMKKDSPVHQEPTNQSWGFREFYVTDSDGNTLRFCQPL